MNLDRFGCGSSSVVFLRKESLELCFAARRVWNVVLLSSGRKAFYLYCLLPLDEFGTSCCFPQGGKSSIVFVVTAQPVWNAMPFSSGRLCLLSLNWTSCLTYRHLTNLEHHAVFSRENILLFVLLSSLNVFGMSCCLSTCLPLTVRPNVLIFPPLDELELCAGFL